MAGHAMSFSVLRVGDHAGGATIDGSMEALLCVTVPLVLASLMHAALAGLRGDVSPVRFRSLALAQVALFFLVEVLEHAGSGARPTVVAALSLGVAAQVAAAGILCALLRGANALGRRFRGARIRPVSPTSGAGRRPATAPAWSLLLLSPLRRRGPPSQVA